MTVRLRTVPFVVLVLLLLPLRLSASEIWVAPTYQNDAGGVGAASNFVWPVTNIGAVRLTLAVPDDLGTFKTAKVVLIPKAAVPASTLTIVVCSAQNGVYALTSCGGPIEHPLAGEANHLVEVDISAAIGPHVTSPGSGYVAILAYTGPTAVNHQILGMRVAYDPTVTSAGTQVINGGNLDLDGSTAATLLNEVQKQRIELQKQQERIGALERRLAAAGQ